MEDHRRRCALPDCALGIPAILIVFTIELRGKPEDPIKVPGVTDLAVVRSGHYHIWNSYRTNYVGAPERPADALADARITIWDDRGHQIPFHRGGRIYETTSVNEVSRSRCSTGWVNVERPGRLRVEVAGVGAEHCTFAKSNVFVVCLFLVGITAEILLIGAGAGLVFWGLRRPRPPTIAPLLAGYNRR
jgi:hypothetical protein